MGEIFLKLLNLSITASWLILAVLVLRLVLKKAPKWVNCALWAMVAVRLICPFSFESALSLIPSVETVPYDIAMRTNPAIDSSISSVNKVINPVIADSFTPNPVASANPLQIVIPVVSFLWLAGMVALLLYALISYIRLKKSVGASITIRDNILACDEVKSPFILGIMKPTIYVPSSMSAETLGCVITHENAHLKRHDHWWKPLGYLLLAVYWFNPLCWVAYILLCRDIEMACDEKVIRGMDRNEKAAYSQALLDCSFPRKRIAACPLAFGEVGVKERVKSVLNYRRPAIWLIAAAVAVCIVLALCFLTDPPSTILSGKLEVSMDMAVAGHHESGQRNGSFIVADYDVLKITKTWKTTTVYAMILYEEFTFDGVELHLEQGSHYPAAITFDSSRRHSSTSSYNVLEYWTPRDGSLYPDDIREKFPRVLWDAVFDYSGIAEQEEKCLQAAYEHYGIRYPSAVYLTDYPENEYTAQIPKPANGTIDYVIDDSINGRYAVFLKDITMEQSESYISELVNAGYRQMTGTKTDVAVGQMFSNNDVMLSVAYSEGVLGIQIIMETSVATTGGVDGPQNVTETVDQP